MFRNYFWWGCQGDNMRCWGWDLGQPCVKQVPYPLCYITQAQTVQISESNSPESLVYIVSQGTVLYPWISGKEPIGLVVFIQVLPALTYI